ncbi:2Fe-2S iron-sulfur cluster-binding protein [Denitrificimonas caeni]|uniref:2Fe-2S iron-sulfur cluster-binding protein n=1 Tax=Denitrificimonas caeni TaxID=521720 RepID=UPI0019659DB2|nr:2Fe-2S iron-sulfur cluster-binding protein [Denitrificimonas caeni]
MKVMLQPSGHVIELLPGEKIIDAARRLGFDAPQSCRNGNCHICAANLISGSVRQGDDIFQSGELFTCLAEPLSDCELQWDGVLAAHELPLCKVACQLVSVTPLGADVFSVHLRLPAGKVVRYHSGQYLLLERENGESSAFSIASAPQQGRDLELHILARDNVAVDLLKYLQKERMARVQMPFGDVHLAVADPRPLLLIAAGTGMAQVRSLVEHCRATGFSQPIHVYWGARVANDFYTLQDLPAWQSMSNLHFHQIVSDDSGWNGRVGLLYQAVCSDIQHLGDYRVIVSGSPAMVYGTFDALVAAGMQPEQMHADVFSYAPRADA